MSNYIILIRLKSPDSKYASVLTIDDAPSEPIYSVTDDAGNSWCQCSRTPHGVSISDSGEEVPFFCETWYTIETEKAHHVYLHFGDEFKPGSFVCRYPLDEDET